MNGKTALTALVIQTTADAQLDVAHPQGGARLQGPAPVVLCQALGCASQPHWLGTLAWPGLAWPGLAWPALPACSARAAADSFPALPCATPAVPAGRCRVAWTPPASSHLTPPSSNRQTRWQVGAAVQPSASRRRCKQAALQAGGAASRRQQLHCCPASCFEPSFSEASRATSFSGHLFFWLAPLPVLQGWVHTSRRARASSTPCPPPSASSRR